MARMSCGAAGAFRPSLARFSRPVPRDRPVRPSDRRARPPSLSDRPPRDIRTWNKIRHRPKGDSAPSGDDFENQFFRRRADAGRQYADSPQTARKRYSSSRGKLDELPQRDRFGALFTNDGRSRGSSRGDDHGVGHGDMYSAFSDPAEDGPPPDVEGGGEFSKAWREMLAQREVGRRPQTYASEDQSDHWWQSSVEEEAPPLIAGTPGTPPVDPANTHTPAGSPKKEYTKQANELDAKQEYWVEQDLIQEQNQAWLVADREPLVQHFAKFGAEIPPVPAGIREHQNKVQSAEEAERTTEEIQIQRNMMRMWSLAAGFLKTRFHAVNTSVLTNVLGRRPLVFNALAMDYLSSQRTNLLEPRSALPEVQPKTEEDHEARKSRRDSAFFLFERQVERNNMILLRMRETFRKTRTFGTDRVTAIVKITGWDGIIDQGWTRIVEKHTHDILSFTAELRWRQMHRHVFELQQTLEMYTFFNFEDYKIVAQAIDQARSTIAWYVSVMDKIEQFLEQRSPAPVTMCERILVKLNLAAKNQDMEAMEAGKTPSKQPERWWQPWMKQWPVYTFPADTKGFLAIKEAERHLLGYLRWILFDVQGLAELIKKSQAAKFKPLTTIISHANRLASEIRAQVHELGAVNHQLFLAKEAEKQGVKELAPSTIRSLPIRQWQREDDKRMQRVAWRREKLDRQDREQEQSPDWMKIWEELEDEEETQVDKNALEVEEEDDVSEEREWSGTRKTVPATRTQREDDSRSERLRKAQGTLAVGEA